MIFQGKNWLTEEFYIAVRRIYDRSINSNMKTYSGNTKHEQYLSKTTKISKEEKIEKKKTGGQWHDGKIKCSLHLSLQSMKVKNPKLSKGAHTAGCQKIPHVCTCKGGWPETEEVEPGEGWRSCRQSRPAREPGSRRCCDARDSGLVAAGAAVMGATGGP